MEGARRPEADTVILFGFSRRSGDWRRGGAWFKDAPFFEPIALRRIGESGQEGRRIILIVVTDHRRKFRESGLSL